MVDPAAVAAALEEALPEGLDVLAVVESPGGALADLLRASLWRIELGCPVERAAAAVQTFLAADEVVVERMTKKGLRSFDCRAAVVGLAAAEGTSGARLDLVLRHTEPAVRPDDVLSGMALMSGEELGPPVLLTRLAQGPLDPATGRVGDPFDASA